MSWDWDANELGYMDNTDAKLIPKRKWDYKFKDEKCTTYVWIKEGLEFLKEPPPIEGGEFWKIRDNDGVLQWKNSVSLSKGWFNCDEKAQREYQNWLMKQIRPRLHSFS